jgi:H+-transporting ATPase
MPVLMLMLITLLNDGTLIAIGYDNVTPNKIPDKWNLKVVFALGSVLGGVACASSLLLLHWLLDAQSPDSFFAKLDLGGLSYGQITTSIYLKVSVSDFLTLFSSRTGGDWFWSKRPANILIGAATIAISMSLILALSWPAARPDEIFTLGLARNVPYQLFVFILFYCIVWWFIQDAAKVILFKFMDKFNIFGIRDTGSVISSATQSNKEGLKTPLLSGAI